MKKSLIVMVMGAGLLAAGCAWSVGGRSETVKHVPTLGQELVDLKTALDSGAMTEEEYHDVRDRLLHGHGK